MKRTLTLLCIGSALVAGNLRADVAPLQQGSKLPFGQLPQPVQTTVKSQSAGANIEDVERGTLNGRTVYEVAFKQNGKHNELRVAEDGTVIDRIVEGTSVGALAATQTAAATSEKYVHLQNGQKVEMNAVPLPVQNTIKNQAGGATIDDIDRGTYQGKTVYEAAFKQNGKHNELRVAEDGSVVARYVEGQNLDLANVPSPTPNTVQTPQQANPGGVAYNAGFKENFDQTRKVDWDTLPQHVRQAIRDRAGNTTKIIDTEVGRTPYGKAYQVAYKRGNKHVESRITHDGKHMTEVVDGQIVYRVGPQQLANMPPKVQQIVRERLGSANLERVQQGTLNNVPFYRFNYVKNGQPMELRLGRDGSNIQEMAVGKSWIDEPAGAANR